MVSDTALVAVFQLEAARILVVFLLVLVGVLVISNLLRTRPSKVYRKVLADMFVSGKIKQLAEDDGIDISEEFEEFKRFMKKQRLSDTDLDNVIEEEMQEAIQDSSLDSKNYKGGQEKK